MGDRLTINMTDEFPKYRSVPDETVPCLLVKATKTIKNNTQLQELLFSISLVLKKKYMELTF